MVMGSTWNRFRRVSTNVGTALLTMSLSVGAVPTLAAVGPAPAAVSLADWTSSPGYGGWYGGQPNQGVYYNQQDEPSTGTTIDSTTASSAQSSGVVFINSDLAYQGAEGAGTGIVLTSDGEVVTNYHVVEGATSIKVTVASTGTTYTATVVGHSATTDVALLQLKDASALTTASIDDDTLGSGDTVTAVGNAEGTGTLTAAQGTVTDLSTSITTEAEGSVDSERLTGLIETSADVVPGDSGGPLLDSEGEVVGIDVAASSGSTSATIDGYAIPIEDALAVVQLILNGTTTATVHVGANAYLGVQVTDTSAAYPNASYGGYGAVPGPSGADLAAVVDGSPAAHAGLVAGDTITAVGSTTIESAADLSTALARYAVADQVQITWIDSSGTTSSATVTLAASPTA
jgi:S1-C subfamily serine protease